MSLQYAREIQMGNITEISVYVVDEFDYAAKFNGTSTKCVCEFGWNAHCGFPLHFLLFNAKRKHMLFNVISSSDLNLKERLIEGDKKR